MQNRYLQHCIKGTLEYGISVLFCIDVPLGTYDKNNNRTPWKIGLLCQRQDFFPTIGLFLTKNHDFFKSLKTYHPKYGFYLLEKFPEIDKRTIMFIPYCIEYESFLTYLIS